MKNALSSTWIRRGLLLSALGIATLATWWMQDTAEKTTPPRNPNAAQPPDYSMSTFSVIEYRAEGSPKYKLSAAEMNHYATDGTSRFAEPNVTFFSPDRAPLVLKADTGVATRDDSEILLNGNVVLERAQDERRPWMKLTTTNVTVHPHDELAETSEPVLVLDPTSRTTAEGMKVHVSDARVTLLSKVRGQYEVR